MDIEKYNIEIADAAVLSNLNRITNQIYKLLPTREENKNWELPLSTVTEELSGMSRLLVSQQEILFSLLCKLEGLVLLTEEKDFFLYRRVIFECLGLMGQVKTNVSR